MTEYCAERPPPRPCGREWVEENFPEMAVPLADPRAGRTEAAREYLTSSPLEVLRSRDERCRALAVR